MDRDASKDRGELSILEGGLRCGNKDAALVAIVDRDWAITYRD